MRGTGVWQVFLCKLIQILKVNLKALLAVLYRLGADRAPLDVIHTFRAHDEVICAGFYLIEKCHCSHSQFVTCLSILRGSLPLFDLPSGLVDRLNHILHRDVLTSYHPEMLA